MESDNTRTVHSGRYVRRHIHRLKKLLKSYRRGSRWAAKSLMAELAAVTEALKPEISSLKNVVVTDRNSIDGNTENVIAALQNYFDEHYSGLLDGARKAGLTVGTVFLVVGLVFLSAALLRFIPMVRPTIDAALRSMGQPPSMLIDLGAPLTAADGVLIGVCR